MPSGGLLNRGVDEAAQLDDALGRLDADGKGLHQIVAQEGALHLGGDDRVVDILARAVAGSRGGAAAHDEADGEETRRRGEQDDAFGKGNEIHECGMEFVWIV